MNCAALTQFEWEMVDYEESEWICDSTLTCTNEYLKNSDVCGNEGNKYINANGEEVVAVCECGSPG